MLTREETLSVDGSPMAFSWARPDGAGPHPAVLVAHHRGGVDDFTHYVLARLARVGLIAVAPDFYHRRPKGEDPIAAMKTLKDNELVDDINAAVDRLVAMPAVRKGRIATVGHCLGGRTSFLALVYNPVLMAAVLLYHGNIFESRGEGMPSPFALTHKIKCPILGPFGKEDRNPSPGDVDTLSQELRRCGIRHEFHNYEGAGHAFQDFHAVAQYRPQAADDAWDKMLGFLCAAMFR
jgi:carboxymethylenebutenolidase